MSPLSRNFPKPSPIASLCTKKALFQAAGPVKPVYAARCVSGWGGSFLLPASLRRRCFSRRAVRSRSPNPRA
ncbi:hypothetical protein AKJ09_04073 [Labilithrix luteola]|uniref:Uncharacterized protein n=1 Tax=Labilithrix luteola TaxID=1391654 RepID=A0A0K1PW90_9BACT|nr:hypothetical protein AKJ09_04073 [Labilithrix luteola]